MTASEFSSKPYSQGFCLPIKILLVNFQKNGNACLGKLSRRAPYREVCLPMKWSRKATFRQPSLPMINDQDTVLLKYLCNIGVKTAMTGFLGLSTKATAAIKVTGQEAIIEEVRTFAFGYCRRGRAEANGARLSIPACKELLLLLGSTFGGDGWDTLALSDMRGRSAVGLGAGPDLHNSVWRQKDRSQ